MLKHLWNHSAEFILTFLPIYVLKLLLCVSDSGYMYNPANVNQRYVKLLREYTTNTGGLFLSNPFQKFDHILQMGTLGQLEFVKASLLFGADSKKMNHQRLVSIFRKGTYLSKLLDCFLILSYKSNLILGVEQMHSGLKKDKFWSHVIDHQYQEPLGKKVKNMKNLRLDPAVAEIPKVRQFQYGH